MAQANLFRKAKSLFSTTLSAGISTGTGETITPASVVGLPTDTEITLTIDRVDASGNATPSAMERITGVISAGNLTDYTRGVDGTSDAAHASGAVVEYIWNADDLNDLVDGILVNHAQTGHLKSGAQIDDTTADHQYIVGVSELTADRTITLPLLTGNDAPVFQTHGLTTSANENFTEYGMSRQAIMNGNFDVWQRGTTNSAFTDNALNFLADRWLEVADDDGGTKPTLTRSRQILTSGDVSNAFYHTRLTTDGAGSSLGVSSKHYLTQRIEHGTRMLCGNGKKVTVSFWARSDIANKRLGVHAIQTYGTTGSPSAAEVIQGEAITLTSTWTKYTHTFTTNTLVGKTFGTSNNDYFQLFLTHEWGATWGGTYVLTGVTAETYVGAGYIDIAQVQLCSGDVALPFQPKSYDEELKACQRYYYKIQAAASSERLGWGFNTNTTVAHIINTFPVEMRIAPTAIEVTATETDYSIAHAATATNCSVVPAFGSANKSVTLTVFTVAAGLTAGQGCGARSGSGNSYLAWSAEL